MKQIVTTALRLDIENAERFFDGTGKGLKEAYQEFDKDVDKPNEYGVQKVFLFIPEAQDDMYTINLN